jgi:hypothetical protein
MVVANVQALHCQIGLLVVSLESAMRAPSVQCFMHHIAKYSAVSQHSLQLIQPTNQGYYESLI